MTTIYNVAKLPWSAEAFQHDPFPSHQCTEHGSSQRSIYTWYRTSVL